MGHTDGTWKRHDAPSVLGIQAAKGRKDVARPLVHDLHSPVQSEGITVAAAPPAGAVLWFESKVRDTSWIDGTAMTRERTVLCSKVDAYGNIQETSFDMDVNRSNDEYVEVLSYTPQTPQHSCTDCVLTRGRFKVIGEVWMSYERYTYDPAGRLKEVWRRAQPGSQEELAAAWEFNGNGALWKATEGTTVRSFQYDAPFQLRVAKQTITEGTKSLVTDFAYDDFGNLNLITGPYLGGSTPGPQKGIKYDDVGRPTAIARQPITGTTITDGIAAFEYADGSTVTPSRVTTYSFAVPLTFSEGSPPATPDVVQTSVFYDALGRAIQVRERLGGVGAAAAGAHVVDNLGSSTYRVSGVVIYDGAGRMTAALEPFYSANGGFVDYRTSSIDNLLASNPVGTHATLRSYDAQGRPTCETYRPVASGASIPAPGSCRSNFTEGLSYTRATAITYRALDGLLGVKSIPSENNLATTPATPEGRSPTGPESFFDASGRLISTLDVDLNATSFGYDAAGRLTTISRSPSVAVSGRPASVVTSFSYDLMDRVTERIDPNAGKRTFWYDAQGRITRVQLPEKPPLGSGVRDELRFDYDMGRLSATKACIATSASPPTTCTTDWSLTYDQAPDGQQAPGQLAYAQKQGLAAIQYAYSPEGIPLRRTYTLAGVSGTFDVSDTALLDGRIAGSTITSPAGSFSFDGYFDSFGRPAKITSAVGGGTTYWKAPIPTATPLTGAYDALGRLGAVDLDQTGTGGSLAHASWQYKPYSGLLDAARASLGLSPGTTDVYWVTGKTYRGSKLTGYRDEVGRTDYSYWYTDAGQLRGATATPFATSPLSQNSSMCSSYTLSKAFGAGASFGNLELVRETRSPAFTDTYAYAGQGLQTTVPPGPDAPTTLTTNSSTRPFLYDHAGRVSNKGLGTETFEYDLFNQLVTVSRSGVQAEKLAHDPLGLLLGRVSGAGSATSPSAEVTYFLGGRATVTATALPGCTAPGCAVDPATVKVDVHLGAVASVRVQGGSAGRVLYYHRDHLGSVVATSKGGGLAGASYRYGPWGDLRVAQGDSGDTASERGFANAIRLSGTLLVMGVRVYDTQLRQFLQPDPVDPMTYTYVGGDPVNRIDPTGMITEAVDPPMPTLEYILYQSWEGWQGAGAPDINRITFRAFYQYIISEPVSRSKQQVDHWERVFVPTASRPTDGPDGSDQTIGGYWAWVPVPGDGFAPTVGMLYAPPIFGDVGRSLRETLTKGPVGYRDLNVSYFSPVGGGLVGVVTDAQTGRHHLELGVGFGWPPGPGASLTGSAQGVTAGWNIALQVNVSVFAIQTGIDANGGIFSEVGVNLTGYPGVSLTGYWVSDWSL